jgi:hypothetical protein
MGDSLLWRYIRYAAKDWCSGGSGEPGCDGPVAVHAPRPDAPMRAAPGSGGLEIAIPETGWNTVSILDIGGRRVFSGNLDGPAMLRIPALARGFYSVRIHGAAGARTERILAY